MYYSWAIRQALEEEMERDSAVILMGEDIGDYGGAFQVTKGLLKKFGRDRVLETPISENGVVGLAAGAALLGLRPVVEIMFMDFVTLAMDPLVNFAAKVEYMYAEQMKVPLVLRLPGGGGRGYGPTHSQSLEAWFMHVPGLKVLAPACPYDAKGLLKSAIRDDSPVIFLESKVLYGRQGDVPDEEYLVPMGQARLVREGSDLTLVAYSRMVEEAEKAAILLEQQGISAEIIDLRSLTPLDEESLATSVQKTGRVLIVEEDCRTGGVGAEVAMRVLESSFDYLNAPPVRVAAEDMPVPCSKPLEERALPNAGKIVEAALRLLEQY